MSQLETVKAHIEKYGSINSIEAIRHYGITRLAARIHELKDTALAMKAEKAENCSPGFVQYVPDHKAREAYYVRQMNETLSNPFIPPNMKSIACLRVAQMYTHYGQQIANG